VNVEFLVEEADRCSKTLVGSFRISNESLSPDKRIEKVEDQIVESRQLYHQLLQEGLVHEAESLLGVIRSTEERLENFCRIHQTNPSKHGVKKP